MHKIIVTPQVQPEDAMWRKVWSHVKPLNWHHMHDWLQLHYECRVINNHRGFTLMFDSLEHKVAFELTWRD